MIALITKNVIKMHKVIIQDFLNFWIKVLFLTQPNKES